MSASIVVIGGAGHMGTRAVAALVELGHDVTVADPAPSPLPEVKSVDVNARDAESVARAIAAADLVMNFAGPYYSLGTTVAKAAIASRKPYVDICDDAEATEELLTLDQQAKDADVPVIVGAGSSPGVLNSLGLRVIHGLTDIDHVLLTWVVGERGDSGIAPLMHFLYGINRDVPVWEEGRRTLVPAFSADSEEDFPFPEPIGVMPVRDIGHPEPVTFPLAVPARAVRNKGGILPRQAAEIFGLFRRLGLTSDRIVRVNGVDVRARDFIATFLVERHNAQGRGSDGDVFGLGVRVQARCGGERVERWLTTGGHMTMADATSLPVTAAATMIIDGAVPTGVHGPEALEPGAWLGRLAVLAPHVYTKVKIWESGGRAATISLQQLAEIDSVGELLS